MGKYPTPEPPLERALTADEQARVLDKLSQLELAAMFTEDWTWGFQHDLWRWETSARRGRLLCADVPVIEAAMIRHGIG